MRPAALVTLALVLALALVAGGCGGTDEAEPTRTPFQQSLATLCDETRIELEGVGEARDVGIDAYIEGHTKIGRRFVRQLKALEPPTYAEKQAAQLVRLFDLYYEGQQYALGFIQAGNRETFRTAEEEALSYLRGAESLATRMGAPECARRPFDPEPES